LSGNGPHASRRHCPSAALRFQRGGRPAPGARNEKVALSGALGRVCGFALRTLRRPPPHQRPQVSRATNRPCALPDLATSGLFVPLVVAARFGNWRWRRIQRRAGLLALPRGVREGLVGWAPPTGTFPGGRCPPYKPAARNHSVVTFA